MPKGIAMDTRKAGKAYFTCPKCGQGIRSMERMKNHMPRCLATGKWARKGGAS